MCKMKQKLKLSEENDEGNKLNISASVNEDKQHHLNNKENKENKQFEHKILAFIVVDTGVGISAERLKQISESKVKTDNVGSNFDGTGVGLSIVLNYIETIENFGLLYNSTQQKT
mmetsp:Transcript_12863/g.27893  ORF Transcript_12863/g.27893 Transcript_12863/m.27893 type:complete len:115 (+) Transcript_12863:916-1260(+)